MLVHRVNPRALASQCIITEGHTNFPQETIEPLGFLGKTIATHM